MQTTGTELSPGLNLSSLIEKAYCYSTRQENVVSLMEQKIFFTKACHWTIA